ncbi:hypothetical protein CsatB_014564 [Cannabis sativa]
MVDSDITSFVLHMNGECEESKFYLIDKWLAFVVGKKVKELKLSANLDPMLYYSLPQIFLENARCLTILELRNIELDTSCSFSFPSLKTLLLHDVHILDTTEDDGAFKFLLGCPSLEKLLLRDAEFDDHFRLQSSSLKFLKVDYLNIYHESYLQVEAINLESLILKDVIFNKIDLSSCKKVRNLSLAECTEDSQSSLQVFISNFPLLEHLTLSFYSFYEYSSKYLKISNQHLKSLIVKEYDPD